MKTILAVVLCALSVFSVQANESNIDGHMVTFPIPKYADHIIVDGQMLIGRVIENCVSEGKRGKRIIYTISPDSISGIYVCWVDGTEWVNIGVATKRN